MKKSFDLKVRTRLKLQPMQSKKIKAILLKKVAYGDDDWIVTVLTEEGRRQSYFAPHARKSQKRFGNILDLFNYLELTLSQKSPDSLPRLEGAELINSSPSICENMAKFAVACYFSEIILEFLQAEQQIPALFTFLIKHLNMMDEVDALPHHFVPAAEHRLLELFGFKPQLSTCLHCSAAITPAGEYFFDGAKGSIVCQDCSPSIQSSPLSYRAIQAILLQTRVEHEDSLQIRRAFEHFIQYTAGKPLKSLQFLSRVLI